MHSSHIHLAHHLFESFDLCLALTDNSLRILGLSRAWRDHLSTEQLQDMGMAAVFNLNDLRLVQDVITHELPKTVMVQPAWDTSERYKLHIHALGGTPLYLFYLEEPRLVFPMANIGLHVERIKTLLTHLSGHSSLAVLLADPDNHMVYKNSHARQLDITDKTINTLDDLFAQYCVQPFLCSHHTLSLYWLSKTAYAPVKSLLCTIDIGNAYTLIVILPCDKEPSNHLPALRKFQLLHHHGLVAVREMNDACNTIVAKLLDVQAHLSDESPTWHAVRDIQNICLTAEKNYLRYINIVNRWLMSSQTDLPAVLAEIAREFPARFAITVDGDIPAIKAPEHLIEDFMALWLANLATHSQGTIAISVLTAYKAKSGNQGTVSPFVSLQFVVSGYVRASGHALETSETKDVAAAFLDSVLLLLNASVSVTPVSDTQTRICLDIPVDTTLTPTKEGRKLRPSGCILLADDDDIIRQSGKMMLESLGYHVLLAKNGLEAIDIYKKNQEQVQVVILDIIMPKLDGQNTYKMMKTINPKVPIIVTSGYYTGKVASSLMRINELDFLLKPFDIEQLAERLHNLLQRE